jgi:CRISPR/Cas system CSM-associated protein Csm3 (group 7 of RAMP superfamily)
VNGRSTTRNAFKNRTIIRGTLKLKSAMSICDGWVEASGDNHSTDVATVALNGTGQPVIPGSSLKGVLRHYLEECGARAELIEQVFGRNASEKKLWNSDLSESELGAGGRADFFTSTADGTTNLLTVDFAGIDRITRTTVDGVLYSSRAVPVGTKFNVCIIGYDLTDEQLGMLLVALKGFNRETGPVRLGSGHADHGGTARWELGTITRVDGASVGSWWNSKTPRQGVWRDAFHEDHRGHLIQAAETAFPEDSLSRPPRLTLKVSLQFDGPFLVNDSRHAAGENGPDLRPRRLSDGRIVLPASSVRGVLRSQAERICRTINKPCIDPRNLKARESEAPDFAGLFGLAGRRAALQITDFISPMPLRTLTRTFVAIDRFTGGAAKGAEDVKSGKRRGKLYTIEYSQEPLLTGKIHIELNRVTPAAIGLLALVGRDLIEGDVTFGMGASRGFGSCHAQISLESVEGILSLMRDNRFGELLKDHSTVSEEFIRSPDGYRPIIQTCVAAFRKLPESQSPVGMTSDFGKGKRR